MKVTPLHIMILLHYHCSAEAYAAGNHDHANSPAVQDFKVDLIRHGVLERVPPEQLQGHSLLRPAELKVTEKGSFWVGKILATPMPVQKIIWE